MKILLFGAGGQVGWELQRSLAPLGAVNAIHQAQLDFNTSHAIREFVRRHAPDVIVNAAAYTQVDKAESEPATAMRINGSAVRLLAEEAAVTGALLVHYSTDYVFDGTKPEPYTEDDKPNPLSVYGRTKLAGERAVQAAGCRHLIFRTSWVYGMHGGNFAKSILRLAKDRGNLSVVSDQFGAPTSAELLADVTALCIGFMRRQPDRHPPGIYHVVASGRTSWYEYAKLVIEGTGQLTVPLKLSPDRVQAISTADYGSPAKRPLNSTLATDKLKRIFDLEMPHWTAHLTRFIAEIASMERR